MENRTEQQPGRRAEDAQQSSRDGSGSQMTTQRAIALGLAVTGAGLLGAVAATSPNKAGDPAQPGFKAEPAPPTDEVVWEAAEAWDLPGEKSNDRIDFFIEFLMGKNHDKTHLWIERLGRFGPMIQEELRKEGMPTDLVYLAMLESGFDPHAHSKANAVGMWQFIEETGKRYGLQVNEYVDERRDPVRATRAALRYLKQMHEERFDSWYLAAAGYNTGENRVSRLLREHAGGARGDEALYWKISAHLPRETRDYVPLMIAVGHIAKNPARYGFADLQYQQPFRYEEVSVPGGTKLDVVARAANATLEEVKELNPHLLKGMTPPGSEYAVRVPVGQARIFAASFGTDAGMVGQYAD